MMTTVNGPQTDITMDVKFESQVIPDGALGDDERVENEESPGGGGDRSPREERHSAKNGHNSDSNQENSEHRRKHRRGKQKGGKHHRKWKPYNKLTWDERKELEERETVRATKKRENLFHQGQPMAPYNTTQFLMEQHEPSDPEFITDQAPEEKLSEENNSVTRASKGDGDGTGSVDSSDEYYDSPTNEDIFLEKEFAETYENFHAERLQSMTKDELVREHLELETRVERLERELKGERGSPPTQDRLVHNNLEEPDQLSNSKGSDDSAAISERQNLHLEIQRLKTENERLQDENRKLRGEK